VLLAPLEFGSEEAKRASVAVKERGPAHRANLSIAEKPAQRYLAQLVSEYVCVMVSFGVKELASAQA